MLEDEFERWIAQSRPRLKRIAKSILKDNSSADDIVQDTLASIWKHHKEGDIRDLNPYSNRAVWLNSLKYRARRRQWVTLDPEFTEEQAMEDQPELLPWELEEALCGLPVLQQAVVRMRYYGGLSFSEIGKSLGISMNTAASRCRYALERLKQELEKNEDEKE